MAKDIASGPGLVLIDDVDKPPPASPGRHPNAPIGYDRVLSAPRTGRAPAQLWVIAGAAVVLALIGAGVAMYRWLEDRPLLAEILGYVVWAALLMAVAAFCYWIAMLAHTAIAERNAVVMRTRVERSRFNVPFDVGELTRRELVLDDDGRPIGMRPAYNWQRHELAHIDYEREGWPHRDHPLLTTRSGGDTTTTIDTSLEPPTLAQVAGAAPQAATLAELEQRGCIRQSDYSLFVGFGGGREGDAVNWPWSHDGGANEPVIAAIGGQPGSGKSQTAAQLVALAIRKGIDVYLFDPQRDSGEGQTLTARLGPLARHLAGRVAGDEHELEQLVAHVERIGTAREQGRDASRTPVLVVIDEFSGTMIGYPNAMRVIDTIARAAMKFRKFNVRWLLVGPSWKSNLVGGDLGTTLASLIRLKLLHGMAPAESAFLTYGLSKEQRREIEALAAGEIIAYGPGTYKAVSVPNLLPRLPLDVAALLPPRSAPIVEWTPPALPGVAQGAPPATEGDGALAAELTRAAAALAVRGVTGRDAQIKVLLMQKKPARTRNGYSWRVKDLARHYKMSDAAISALAAQTTRGGGNE